ncbi:MAG: RNA polymerase sigma factor [Deltaproteobacteria bacterium]|nr:RNA polymerase sigma factor [Deltaproteobacteria bacterium]
MTRDEVDAIFRRFGPMVFRRARTLLRNEEEGRDVMQEVFIKAMAEPSRFEDPADAGRWLYRVTTNTCLNILRDTHRRAELRNEHLAPSLAVQASRTEGALSLDQLAARRLLAEADAACSQAAVLVHVDGMSYDEASAVLGVSKRTISNLLLRFRTFATKRLGESWT